MAHRRPARPRFCLETLRAEWSRAISGVVPLHRSPRRACPPAPLCTGRSRLMQRLRGGCHLRQLRESLSITVAGGGPQRRPPPTRAGHRPPGPSSAGGGGRARAAADRPGPPPTPTMNNVRGDRRRGLSRRRNPRLWRKGATLAAMRAQGGSGDRPVPSHTAAPE